jgi:cytochrome o ubiquinol oxidase subunit 1
VLLVCDCNVHYCTWLCLIWHIWWLVVVSFVAAVVSLIVSSFTKNVDYVPAAEVERIENERYALLEKHLKKD